MKHFLPLSLRAVDSRNVNEWSPYRHAQFVLQLWLRHHKRSFLYIWWRLKRTSENVKVYMDFLRKQWGLWVWQTHNNEGLLSPSISHSQRRVDSFIPPAESVNISLLILRDLHFFGFCATVVTQLQRFRMHMKNNKKIQMCGVTYTHTAPAKSGLSFQIWGWGIFDAKEQKYYPPPISWFQNQQQWRNASKGFVTRNHMISKTFSILMTGTEFIHFIGWPPTNCV